MLISLVFINSTNAQVDALESLNLDELTRLTEVFGDEQSVNSLSPSAAAESNSQLQFENTVKQLQRVDNQTL